MTFIDSFVAVIDHSTNLSDVKKFNYLFSYPGKRRSTHYIRHTNNKLKLQNNSLVDEKSIRESTENHFGT